MSTRIRYSKNGNQLISVKAFQHPTNGGRFSVIIDSTTFNWTVRDNMAEMTAMSGTAGSLNRAKIFAKQALQELGINFETEERPSRKLQEIA